MTAPLPEAEEAGAVLFGWLAEAKHWRRKVTVMVDDIGYGYLVLLEETNSDRPDPAGFSGATRDEALMAAARWVAEGKKEIGE